MTNTNDTLPGALLLRFRQRFGLTQREAAEWWGCGLKHWNQMENHHRNVPRPLRKRVEALLVEQGIET